MTKYEKQEILEIPNKEFNILTVSEKSAARLQAILLFLVR